MKNKKITMYELIGRVKANEAPKKIKFKGQELTYHESCHDYADKSNIATFFYSSLGNCVDTLDFFNSYVEIIDEKNDEFEDIEEIGSNPDDELFVMQSYVGIPERAQDWNFEVLKEKTNQLI